MMTKRDIILREIIFLTVIFVADYSNFFFQWNSIQMERANYLYSKRLFLNFTLTLNEFKLGYLLPANLLILAF